MACNGQTFELGTVRVEQDLSMTYVIITYVQKNFNTLGAVDAAETAEEAVNHANAAPLKPIFLSLSTQ